MTDHDTTDDQPIREPANSTVDDWHGQEIERDTAAAEEAMREAGGDEELAEQIFEQTRPVHPSEQWKVPEDERPT